MEGGGEILNFDEYVRTFPSLLGIKPPGFVSEASRASAMISMSSLALVETLLDPNRWREMFVGMIGSSATVEVISNGTGDSRNGVLQLMKAEIQHISPLVHVRVVNFIRFSRQHAEGMMAMKEAQADESNPMSDQDEVSRMMTEMRDETQTEIKSTMKSHTAPLFKAMTSRGFLPEDEDDEDDQDDDDDDIDDIE